MRYLKTILLILAVTAGIFLLPRAFRPDAAVQRNISDVSAAPAKPDADPVVSAQSAPGFVQSTDPVLPVKTALVTVGESPDSSLISPTPVVSEGVYQLIVGEDQRVVAVARAADAAGAVDEDYAYVRQSRKILFDTTLLTPASPLKAGDTLVLELMSNVSYSVVIDRVSCDSFGSLSILGTIKGTDFSTVTITANNGKVIGTVQDMENNKLFRIRYSSTDCMQEVLDYDLERMPTRIDMPPRIPEENGSP